MYFVFYHSLELDMICEDGDNDGTSYEGVKFLGYAWLFVFLFVCGCSWIGDGARWVGDGDKSGSFRN